MVEPSVRLRFDGGDAERNAIDAKLFGQSLQGLDRMVSDALLIFSQQRLPKRGERSPLILKVREPLAGSYDVPALYQETSQLLGFGIPIVNAIGPEIINHYVKAVLAHFKGDDEAVEVAISKMTEMHAAALASLLQAQKMSADIQRQVEDHRHKEHVDMQNILRLAITGSGPAAVDYVAPIGRSVDTATFAAGGVSVITTNKDDADLIRESQRLDWEPVRELRLRVDGFRFHSNALSVENPERDGFLMADVNDPAFDAESNKYTSAAQRKALIQVLARRGYKNGKLAAIQIVDFIAEIDEKAS